MTARLQDIVYEASLPMYDWPEQQHANNRFWQLLRQALIDNGLQQVPRFLSRTNPERLWCSPNNLISQTCGYPLKHSLGTSVEILGTPCYNVPYCKDGYYASLVLVRNNAPGSTLDQFAGSVCAINSKHSQSGCNALMHLLKQHSLTERHFSHYMTSGSHRESVVSVASQTADLCAVDPVSWELATRYEPCAKHLRVLCTTAFSPALPLISSSKVAATYTGRNGSGAGAFSSLVRQSWNEAMDSDSRLAKELMLTGMRLISRSKYNSVP